MTEDMIFDVVAPGLEKIKMIEREIKALGAESRKAGKASADGFDQASRSVRELATEEAKLRYEKEKLSQAVRQQLKAFDEEVAALERVKRAKALTIMSGGDVASDQAKIRAQQQAVINEQQAGNIASMNLNRMLAGFDAQIKLADELASKREKEAAAAQLVVRSTAQEVAQLHSAMSALDYMERSKEEQLSVQQRTLAAQKELSGLMAQTINVNPTEADVKAAKAMAEYQRLGREIDVVTKRISLMQQMSDASSDAMVQDVNQQRIALAALQRQQALVHRELSSVTGGMGNAGLIAQQLAYAVDDAAISFGVGGLAGAVLGASNNLSAVAMIMGGPLTGAIAGVSLAIGGMLLGRWLEMKDTVKDVDKEMEAHKRHVNGMAKAYQDLSDRIDKATLSEKKFEQKQKDKADKEALKPFDEHAAKLFNERIVLGQEWQLEKRREKAKERDDPRGAEAARQKQREIEDRMRDNQAAIQQNANARDQVVEQQKKARGLENIRDFKDNAKDKMQGFGDKFREGMNKQLEKHDPRNRAIQALRDQEEEMNRKAKDARDVAEKLKGKRKQPFLNIADQMEDQAREAQRKREDIERQRDKEKKDREQGMVGMVGNEDAVGRFMNRLEDLAHKLGIGGGDVRVVNPNGQGR